MTLKIFISHSSADAQIAEALIKLFQRSLNIPSSQIRCTSVDGYRLPGGSNTTEALKKEVEESEVFVGLMTKTSIQSTYVLFEMGARWASSKKLMPVLAAGATPRVLKPPLSDYNALDCNNEAQIYQLLEDMSEALNMRLERANTYSDLIISLIKESSSRGEAEVDFNVILDSIVVGQASDDHGNKATSVLATCSIINLSDRHVIISDLELDCDIDGKDWSLDASRMPDSAEFTSERKDFRIENPQKYDLMRRLDSVAPGQGISGLVLFMGEPNFYSVLNKFMRLNPDVELGDYFSVTIIDINGLKYRCKVVSNNYGKVSLFRKLGFSPGDA
jgi:hypothetical protein